MWSQSKEFSVMADSGWQQTCWGEKPQIYRDLKKSRHEAVRNRLASSSQPRFNTNSRWSLKKVSESTLGLISPRFYRALRWEWPWLHRSGSQGTGLLSCHHGGRGVIQRGALINDQLTVPSVPADGLDGRFLEIHFQQEVCSIMIFMQGCSPSHAFKYCSWLASMGGWMMTWYECSFRYEVYGQRKPQSIRGNVEHYHMTACSLPHTQLNT